MLEALGWGALAASALAAGAVIGVVRPWPDTVVGLVLGFGAGGLISAVTFELAREGLQTGGLESVALGLVVGAVTFFLLDGAVDRLAERQETPSGIGTSLALGAFLDGVPANVVLGIGLSRGEGVSVALLAAILVSDLPESMGSAASLREAGGDRRKIVGLWLMVVAACALSTMIGFTIADAIDRDLVGLFNGFAAGALIVMLVSSMAPEASEKVGRIAGLATTIGFAAAVALSSTS